MFKGLLTVRKNSTPKKYTVFNTISDNFAEIAVDVLSGINSESVTTVKFGDGSIPPNPADTSLSGNVMLSKRVEGVSLLDWNKCQVEFNLLSHEISDETITELGLFTTKNDILFSKILLPSPMIHGNAKVDFTWKFKYVM